MPLPSMPLQELNHNNKFYKEGLYYEYKGDVYLITGIWSNGVKHEIVIIDSNKYLTKITI